MYIENKHKRLINTCSIKQCVETKEVKYHSFVIMSLRNWRISICSARKKRGGTKELKRRDIMFPSPPLYN